MSLNSSADPALAIRNSSAMSLRLRMPSRRSVTAVAAAVSAATAATGAVLYATNPGDAGAWLLVAGGVIGGTALLRAADLHRRSS